MDRGVARRVVVGFDGSPAALAALRWAADEARLHHAELAAYTITHDNGRALAQPPSPTLIGGYPLSVHRIAGDVPACLRAACTPDDLLVLGTRARPPLSELVLGSISRACLTHAPCPVVVIRTPDQLRRSRGWVIAAVRSSPAAQRALVVAAAEARLRAGPLIAVHATQVGNVDPQLFPAAATRLLDQGRQWLDAELQIAGVLATPDVVLGPAAETLVRRSAHATLLVMGAHESPAPWGGTPGATITHCVHRSHCPVMVVPAIPDQLPRSDDPTR